MELLPILLIIGALYAFMIVPQQRRMKAHQALLNSLKEGDLVVTSAGIHGAIAEVENDVVWVEVAPEVELKIAKAAITEKVNEADDDDDDDEDEDEDDDSGDSVAADADADDES